MYDVRGYLYTLDNDNLPISIDELDTISKVCSNHAINDYRDQLSYFNCLLVEFDSRACCINLKKNPGQKELQ